MLGKINIGMAIAALLLLALLLSGNEFKPFPNFIFAFLVLMFLSQSIESFRENKRWEGVLQGFVSVMSLLVVVTGF
ncbi:hypothetical protein ON064_11760 [Planococcus sp. A6]|uniref:hypothetical protein n=1 Tax=Planococcus sp. A6 TaxID=2992760 RepID=UPI00237B1544|nr:hypothetical protein [Planococcus sp. A6]MDE0583708.1 hypothetical protein [Planococcus sp. A6]